MSMSWYTAVARGKALLDEHVVELVLLGPPSSIVIPSRMFFRGELHIRVRRCSEGLASSTLVFSHPDATTTYATT